MCLLVLSLLKCDSNHFFGFRLRHPQKKLLHPFKRRVGLLLLRLRLSLRVKLKLRRLKKHPLLMRRWIPLLPYLHLHQPGFAGPGDRSPVLRRMQHQTSPPHQKPKRGMLCSPAVSFPRLLTRTQLGTWSLFSRTACSHVS